ncbi:MAG: DUF3592 domain-containing protein [Planctomycetota bacterium]|jgi:hypothetical protein
MNKSDCYKNFAGSTIFILIGLFLVFYIFLKPVSDISRAKEWVETECVIESMDFKETGDGPESETYTDVIYSYEFGGKNYKSNVYELGTSFDNFKQRSGIMYSAGEKATCFVNPDNPAEAVMVKPTYSNQLWWVVLPIIFILIGSSIGVYALRQYLIAIKN